MLLQLAVFDVPHVAHVNTIQFATTNSRILVLHVSIYFCLLTLISHSGNYSIVSEVFTTEICSCTSFLRAPYSCLNPSLNFIV